MPFIVMANLICKTDKGNIMTLPHDFIELATRFFAEHTSKPLCLDPDVLAYRWTGGKTGTLTPIDVSTSATLDDLLGIDTQKTKIIANTRQFVARLPANHVLMTGTRGAGKSSLVRALLGAFYQDGLRVIEVARDDLQFLDKIRHAIKEANNGCRYIVYCDDLAFNAQDENYRTLKSILDGSLDSENDHLLVYATSNRRHLLPQLMKDNVNIYNGQTDEINPYETIDETVSLSDRFGVWLSFHPMNQEVYLDIVAHYLSKHGMIYDDNVRTKALQWASTRGGRSGRVAYQFSRDWVGQNKLTTQEISQKPK